MSFHQCKEALSASPVLGHPIQGSPYCLYTDASDVALGASLQQIQHIAIHDLHGTPLYNRLKKAWSAGSPLPSLYPVYVKEIEEREVTLRVWGATFDKTIVQVERVIAYWS